MGPPHVADREDEDGAQGHTKLALVTEIPAPDRKQGRLQISDGPVGGGQAAYLHQCGDEDPYDADEHDDALTEPTVGQVELELGWSPSAWAWAMSPGRRPETGDADLSATESARQDEIEQDPRAALLPSGHGADYETLQVKRNAPRGGRARLEWSPAIRDGTTWGPTRRRLDLRNDSDRATRTAVAVDFKSSAAATSVCYVQCNRFTGIRRKSPWRWF